MDKIGTSVDSWNNNNFQINCEDFLKYISVYKKEHKIICFENTWYSVISPEGCASILFRDAARAEEAADAMMVTAKDLKEFDIADIILEEPEGGTHLDYDQAASTLKQVVIDSILELNKIEPESRILNRIKKYEKMGRWSDG